MNPLGVLCSVNMNEPFVERKFRSVKQLPYLCEKQKKIYIKCLHSLKNICEIRNDQRRKKEHFSIEQISHNEAVNKLCSNMTSSLAVLLQMQLRNCGGVHVKRKWTRNDKVKALSLYKRSPPTYRLLRRLFSLPSQGYLNRFLRKLKFDCGINPRLFTVLEKFYGDTKCCLIFGRMPLKRKLSYNKKEDLIEGFVDCGSLGRRSCVASSALVFMVSGIKEKYVQPIAYYFCEESLTPELFSRIIKQVLRQCFKANLKICATICDFTKNNREVLKHLGATTDHPYFLFCQREIITIFDPFDLTIRLRNCFMRYGIKIVSEKVGMFSELLFLETSRKVSPKINLWHQSANKGVAKWEHVKSFFEIDRNSKYSLAYNLTEAHVYPNKKQKKSVGLAAELLCSQKLFAGMNFRRMRGELPDEAEATAFFIYKMHTLFKCLTAGLLERGNTKLCKIRIEYQKSQYIHDLIDFLNNNIEIVGQHKKNLLFLGWVHTLAAIKKLWWIVRKSSNIFGVLLPDSSSLPTKRLNGNILRDCFHCIRRNSGHKMKPTTKEFAAGLKTAILTKMSRHYLSDYETQDFRMIRLKYFSNQDLSDGNTDENSLLINLKYVEKYIDYAVERGFEKNDISTFICKLILNAIDRDCSLCKKILFIADKNVSNSSLNYKNNHVKRELFHCVVECVSTVDIFLRNNLHKKNLRNTVVVFIQEKVNFEVFGSCATHYNENVETVICLIFYLCVKYYCELRNRSLHWEIQLPPILKHDHPYV